MHLRKHGGRPVANGGDLNGRRTKVMRKSDNVVLEEALRRAEARQRVESQHGKVRHWKMIDGVLVEQV